MIEARELGPFRFKPSKLSVVPASGKDGMKQHLCSQACA